MNKKELSNLMAWVCESSLILRKENPDIKTAIKGLDLCFELLKKHYDPDTDVVLSNHSVLHSIIERSLPTLSEINEGANKFERYKDTMSEAEAAESSARYWGFKEGVDWMKKRMTSL